MYKLTCSDRKKAYIRQKDRNFTIIYDEHKHAFWIDNHSSRFAQHLNEHARSFGTIDNTMHILHYQKKGAHLNTIECFYIHAEYTSNHHLNDSHTTGLFCYVRWEGAKELYSN